MNAEISTPAWHLYDFDDPQQQSILLQLGESDYRAASFLDQRVEALAKQRRELPLHELQDTLGVATRPARCIFHLGHCGSTLLSRALAASPNVLPLREPLTLRRLAAEPAARHLLPLVLSAHTRVFHPAQVAMIKASSVCNQLIDPLLRHHPDSRAILLYVPLETHLAGMLGKLTSPVDLSAQAKSKLADWRAITGAAPLEVEDLDTTQLAVLAWLTSMYFLLAAAGSFPQQALLLDFEVMLVDAEASLVRCASFMGLGPKLEGETNAILAAWPEISTSYSKQPDLPYSAFNRRKTLQRGRSTRRDDIKRGMNWAKALVSATAKPAGSQSLEQFFS
ncbi:MAG: hypothetical protein EXR85_05785 [Xanthomonadales bacterium]|nr:hypothetical protein [Xanthomonadales bacterium]